jgi:hypothetical protein
VSRCQHGVSGYFWVFCGLVLLAMAWTFPRDEARLRAVLAQKASGEAS